MCPRPLFQAISAGIRLAVFVPSLATNFSFAGLKMNDRIAGESLVTREYGEETIAAVWEKGRVVPGTDPSRRRKDCCGAWIDRDQYGVMMENGTGWEIGSVPDESGGDAENLQPLQWENNRARLAVSSGTWFCVREARVSTF